MTKKERISRYTVEQLKAIKSKTDWARVNATTEAEIEAQALADEGPMPEGWKPEWFSGTIEPKKDVHIRLEQSVLRWFKAPGPGYQTRINAVLRAFVQERERNKRSAG